MAKLIYRWTATFETTLEVDDPTNVDEVRNEGANINIPEDEYTEYQEDTFEIEKVEDEYGNPVDY
tara:strand:+ start:6410 stop:6604 length:195 start_codon:yes stop_codon:yes gene_type:complete